MNEEINTLIKNRFGSNGEIDEKTLFLVKMALNASIESAVRRNTYNYRPTVREDHSVWKRLLIKHSISIPTTVDSFVKDVEKLKSELCTTFGEEATIRLSHAQKSLSVFLKYLWCFNLIDMPPACPIDRKVLRLVNNSPISNWTALDKPEDYLFILRTLESLSKPDSLAIKELTMWNI